MTIICPYCQTTAPLVTGQTVYPHRPDLYTKSFYFCQPCDAYVGCHNGTAHALGRLANAELRAAKIRAHSAFDLIWKTGSMRRGDAYTWLAEKLQIEKTECHIGMFDVAMCDKVVTVCEEYQPWN